MTSEREAPAGGSRRAGAVVALALGLLLSGCISATSYVDPALPPVSLAEVTPPANPRPVQLLFEFRTRGSPNFTATDLVRPRVIAALSESRCFSSVTVTPQQGARLLSISIDNIVLTDDLEAKAFGTGLTFGLAGTMVTDGYVMEASLGGPGEAPANRTYRHALHTAIGNAPAPPGLAPMTPQEAVNRIIDQLVLSMLRDMARDGRL